MSEQSRNIVISWLVGTACGIAIMLVLYPATRHWPSYAKVDIGQPRIAEQ